MSHGLKPGDEVVYTRTFLEMTARPAFPRPHAPLQPGLALIRAEDPPARWFFHLYDSVGEGHEWRGWHEAPRESLDAFLGDEKVAIFALMLQGWTAGFFMLDWREAGRAELAYFGLTPEAAGRGLGKWLLQTAIHAGWDEPGVTRMTVNTCSLDHPRALPLYQKMGFAPVRRETLRRVLTHPLSPEVRP